MLINSTAEATVKAQIYTSLMACLMLVVAPNAGLMAQGLQSERAIDVIVGSDVTTAQENARADESRILAAIDRSAETASDVRKKFSLDHVEIIFLPDIGEGNTAVETKLEEKKAEIMMLHEAIQGSAMFYHAIDSRSIMLNAIVALEFDDKNGVTIFVSGEEPSTLQAE